MVFDSSLGSRWWFLTFLIAATTVGLGTAPGAAAVSPKFWVFVGTFTDGKSQGIYRMVLDTASGKLSEPSSSHGPPSL